MLDDRFYRKMGLLVENMSEDIKENLLFKTVKILKTGKIGEVRFYDYQSPQQFYVQFPDCTLQPFVRQDID